MPKQLARRWWLVPMCAVIGLAIGGVVAAMVNYRTEPLYMGRTTVQQPLLINVAGPIPHKDLEAMVERGLSGLAGVAKSPRVIDSASRTLGTLGVALSPEEIRSHFVALPVSSTAILALEISLPRPEEAKVAANVLASELKKAYAETNARSGSPKRLPPLMVVDPARVYPVNQRKMERLSLTAALGAVLGIVAGLVLSGLLPGRESEESPVAQ